VFDVPVDGWYAWLGVAAVSVLLLATATSLPTQPPPDAARAADAVDRVAAGDHAATAEIPLAADTVTVGSRRLTLRNDAGASHAAFAFGPVTPVGDAGPLAAVLAGATPAKRFASPAALANAAARAREAPPGRRGADSPLLVRTLRWGDLRVTLVGV
jgi:hypothetical protein